LKRIVDDAVDEAVAIELGGVDVIDAEFDCAADYAVALSRSSLSRSSCIAPKPIRDTVRPAKVAVPPGWGFAWIALDSVISVPLVVGVVTSTV